MSKHRYHLAKCNGRSTRLVCPNCGKRELVPYIDEKTGEILDPSCGRCNRESKCSYHLPPREFFRQNPGARPQGDAQGSSRGGRRSRRNIQYIRPLKKEETIWELPRDVVESTFRGDCPCDFISFLRTLFPEATVQYLIYLYRIGVTGKREVVFYEIDQEGRYRGGKVIGYNPVTGGRIKHTGHDVDWLHFRLAKKNLMPENWKLTQVLFGEHLLKEYPDKLCILVESEKTAVVGAGYCPQYLWLATGGKTQLGDKLNVLQGRRVVVIPDVDAFEYWSKYFGDRPYLGFTISRIIEDNATLEDREAQIDIADWLIRAYGPLKKE